MRYWGLIQCLCVWLLAGCDKPEPAVLSHGAAAADEKSASSEATPPVLAVKEEEVSAHSIELKSIVAPLLSRELFKLDPTTAQKYFVDIAALQPQANDEAWLKRFEGKSKLPWLEGALVELQQDGDRWRLGQCQLTWRPPRQEALALYEKLVAEVQAIRGRRPSFQRDDGESGKRQRSVGWNWCKETCEAIVALDSDGQSSLTKSAPIDENHPAVSLTVYTPEGP